MNSAIAWMARHPVAANLLMIFIIAAGLISIQTVPVKVFPEFDLDTVEIRVEYPGASPTEIEDSILRRIEEQVEGVDGIDLIRARGRENLAIVEIELKRGADPSQKLDEIKAEIDRIVTFPEEAEEPVVTLLSNRQRVIEIAIAGDASEQALKELANQVKDDLTRTDAISFVQIATSRDYEISIEVPLETLRRYNLSLPEIAAIIEQASLDLPGGEITTDFEEVRVRTLGQNYRRTDYEDIVVATATDGGLVRLGDIARIDDGFEEGADLITRFNGKPAAFIQVFRIGNEQVLDIVDTVESYLAERLRPRLPEGMEVKLWRNDAEELKNRINLLFKNGSLGLLLVILALALFLDLRLAFWVSVGIFVSFVGAIGIMSVLGQSINQTSLFGFILTIGIVVDDAIIVGENIFAYGERGMPPHEAAVQGAQRVGVPVLFAVTTTVTAFLPTLYLPAAVGKFLAVIPVVVISVFVLSLIESLFVLPHHLSNVDVGRRGRGTLLRLISAAQNAVDRALTGFIEGPLDRAVSFAARRWFVTLAGGFAILAIMVGLPAGGYIKFVFFPEIEDKYVTASLTMTEGTPIEVTRREVDRLARIGRKVGEELGREFGYKGPVVRDLYLIAGGRPARTTPLGQEGGAGEPSQAAVVVRLPDPSARDFSARVFEQRWRRAAGQVPGARQVVFSSSLVELGPPVALELSAGREDELEEAVAAIKRALRGLPGVVDVRDDRDRGLTELEVRLKPEARLYGLTLHDLAGQVRAAWFGAEALRVQRGREEVRVFVRLPDEERNARRDFLRYRIKTPQGAFVPISEVADVSVGTGPAAIERRDGRRIITVTADVDTSIITGDEALAHIDGHVWPGLTAKIPSLTRGFSGEQRQQQQAVPALLRNLLIALCAIYVLLALPFRSYWQPFVVMVMIPFGLVGATLGHMLMGINLTFLSVWGLVGLSGVIINDALLLIDFTNERLRAGVPMADALRGAARARFRPILLTSLTTFLGVFPLIIEQSVQAQFLVPLAVSIGFGVLFAALLQMMIVPAVTMAFHTGLRLAGDSGGESPGGIVSSNAH